MNQPRNYDNTRIGNFERVQLGAHAAVIKAVEEMKSKTGRDMIKVSIDFDTTDEQAGYFMQRYREDTRNPKAWPNQATSYILVEDNDGNTNRNFKTFCLAYEDSNGLTTQWGPAFAAQFKDRKIGVVYGEVDDEYQGRIRTLTKIRWFCDIHKLDEQTEPAKKTYTGTVGTRSTAEFAEFMSADDSPFR